MTYQIKSSNLIFIQILLIFSQVNLESALFFTSGSFKGAIELPDLHLNPSLVYLRQSSYRSSFIFHFLHFCIFVSLFFFFKEKDDFKGNLKLSYDNEYDDDIQNQMRKTKTNNLSLHFVPNKVFSNQKQAIWAGKQCFPIQN